MYQNKEIDNLVEKSFNSLKIYEEMINTNQGSYKKILLMFLNEISFMKGISTLLSNGCYDSIFSIARQYLEGYALCSYSIEKYNDKEFDELFEKLLLVDLHQDIKVYEGLPTNFTSKEKDKYF